MLQRRLHVDNVKISHIVYNVQTLTFEIMSWRTLCFEPETRPDVYNIWKSMIKEFNINKDIGGKYMITGEYDTGSVMETPTLLIS